MIAPAKGGDRLAVEREEIGMGFGCSGAAEYGIERVSGGGESKDSRKLLGNVLETVLSVQLVTAVKCTVHLSHPLELGGHIATHFPHLRLFSLSRHNGYISAKSRPHGHSALLAEAHAEGVQPIHLSLLALPLSLEASLEGHCFQAGRNQAPQLRHQLVGLAEAMGVVGAGEGGHVIGQVMGIGQSCVVVGDDLSKGLLTDQLQLDYLAHVGHDIALQSSHLSRPCLHCRCLCLHLLQCCLEVQSQSLLGLLVGLADGCGEAVEVEVQTQSFLLQLGQQEATVALHAPCRAHKHWLHPLHLIQEASQLAQTLLSDLPCLMTLLGKRFARNVRHLESTCGQSHCALLAVWLGDGVNKHMSGSLLGVVVTAEGVRVRVEGTNGYGWLLVGLKLGLLRSVLSESFAGVTLSALLLLLPLSLEVLQRHLHLLLPPREVLILQQYLVLVRTLPVAAPALGSPWQFGRDGEVGVGGHGGLARVFAGLFEYSLFNGRLAGVAVGVMGVRTLVLQVGVDILFVVDFLELTQEGVTLLGRGQGVAGGGGLSDAMESIAHAAGRVCLALLASVQHHLNNNEQVALPPIAHIGAVWRAFTDQYIVGLQMEDHPRTTLPADFLPGEVFRVELSAEEAQALASLLPKGYSFHLDARKKEQKPPAKKKTPEELLLAAALDFKPKPAATLPPPPPAVVAKKTVVGKQEGMSEAVKPCLKTLQLLQQHKCALPFIEPVDVEALNIPEYREIVREPMDLQTIEGKLRNGRYSSPLQFHQDVLKIFHNSYLFNAANEDFVKITNEFQKYYYRISGEFKPQPDKTAPKPLPQPKQKKKKKPTMSRELNDSQPMSIEEKRELAAAIERLAKEHLKGVRTIVFDGSEGNEFDLEQLSQKKLRELQKYVRGRVADMESSLRCGLTEKTEQQNLDDLDSDITQQFIDIDL